VKELSPSIATSLVWGKRGVTLTQNGNSREMLKGNTANRGVIYVQSLGERITLHPDL